MVRLGLIAFSATVGRPRGDALQEDYPGRTPVVMPGRMDLTWAEPAVSFNGHCPIERAMGLVGSRSAMLIMREAFYGTSRFDDFVQRVEMAPATASTTCARSPTPACCSGGPTANPAAAPATSTR